MENTFCLAHEFGREFLVGVYRPDEEIDHEISHYCTHAGYYLYTYKWHQRTRDTPDGGMYWRTSKRFFDPDKCLEDCERVIANHDASSFHIERMLLILENDNEFIFNLYSWLLGLKVMDLANKVDGVSEKNAMNWKLHVNKFAWRAQQIISAEFIEEMCKEFLDIGVDNDRIKIAVKRCVRAVTDVDTFVLRAHAGYGYGVFYSDVLHEFFTSEYRLSM